jgi:2-isopropylmalate synthase
MTVDVVRESVRAGRVVLWEESARDGAQARTLMSAGFRSWLAREQGAMFGAAGPQHVVFAAGFPAVCQEEFDAVRRVALDAEGFVSVAAVCRATADDVAQATRAVRGSAGARVMVVVPASEAMARVMTHTAARQALRQAVGLVEQARDRDGMVAVDICFADATRADPALMADAANAVTAAGAGTVILADTVGAHLTSDTAAMTRAVAAGSAPEVVLGSHLHNDLGLGLANTLEMARHGVRLLSSSWLGLAERVGMVATEQLLFLLAHRSEALLGAGAQPWIVPPDLTRVPILARAVAHETGTPLPMTAPIVGPGVNSISTGTPFVRPELFRPFDPEALLGIQPTVVLTHLASARLVTAVAARLGWSLTREEARTAMTWVKARAFTTGDPVVDETTFAAYLGDAFGTTAAARPSRAAVLA